MAFQTGSVNNSTDLQTIIETFCAANGWSLSGNVLSKGASNVRLTVTDSGLGLKIEGANSADFATSPCAGYGRIYIGSSYWPATYYLFLQSIPDTVVCIIQYNTNFFEWLAFGNANVLGSYSGGNWFGAVRQQFNTSIGINAIGGVSSNLEGAKSTGALFWGNNGSGSTLWYNRSCFIHAELDGYIWPGDDNIANVPTFPEYANPIHLRSPNAWNDQSPLTPLWLFFVRPSNFVSLIAELGHVRNLRIDNYNPGDIITLGADRWMVFPWFSKNAAERDGPLSSEILTGIPGHTGTFGWAIRYDGP